MEDIKEHKNGKFITLTFSNKSYKELYDDVKTYELIDNKRVKRETELTGYDLDNAIAKRATRLFLERWRKKYKKSLRHWLVTELGHNGTENIHLHGIVWTDEIHELKNIWSYGFVWDGDTINGKKKNYVNEQTVNYIVKYINKADDQHKYYKSKVLSSPGIGAGYTKSRDSERNKFNVLKINPLKTP